jgi:hypothetical protein
MPTGNSFGATLGDLLGAVPAVTLILGLVHCIAGYRIWVGLLGLYGLVLAATLAGALGLQWFPDHPTARLLMQAGAGMFGFGAVLAFHRVGVFVLGALAGALVAELLGTGLGTGVSDPVLLLAAGVGGSAAVTIERGALILATSITGAALVVRSAVAMLHGPAAWSLGALDLWSWPAGGPALEAQLAAWVILIVLGVAIQRRA